MNMPETSSSPDGTPLGRRTLLGVAAVAALAGVGVGLWSLQTRRNTQAAAVTDLVGDFWALQWATPDGGLLPVRSFQGKPLLLNFWATWCPPCVEELPLINDFYRLNKANGWQVLGLAVDQPRPVQAFLEKMPLDFPVAMAGAAGAELGRALGNVTGGLPFSVVLAADGVVSHRKLGRLTADNLEQWARLK